MDQSGIVLSGTFEKQHAVGSILGGLRGLQVLPVFERLQVVVFPKRAGYRVTLHLNKEPEASSCNQKNYKFLGTTYCH